MAGEEAVAVADSTTQVQAAPLAAAGSADVTHGEPTEQPTTTSDEAVVAEPPAEPSEDTDDEHDPETEPSEEDSPEEAKSKAQRRRENRIRREQERIEREVAERLAAKEREREQKAAAEQREADAAKAREQAAKEFAAYLGEEGESDRLAAENAELHRRIRAEIGTLTQDEFDTIEKTITANESRMADIEKARGFEGKIREHVWNGIEAHILSPVNWPELADPAAKARYLGAEGGIAGALAVLKDVVRSAAIAEKDAEIAELKKSHASELATRDDAIREWRVRAGVEEVPDTTSGGAAATSGGIYTRERIRQMMRTPEGMAEYRRNKAEIERQELAGLIR